VASAHPHKGTRVGEQMLVEIVIRHSVEGFDCRGLGITKNLADM
jgi:hypothetical protein